MEASQYQAAREKQARALQRQREKQAAKQADPEYRQQQASASRMIARQIERRNSPDWKAEQKAKALKRAVSA